MKHSVDAAQTVAADLNPILGLLRRLLRPREVFEVRVTRQQKLAANGYFDDPSLLVDEVAPFAGADVAVMLNPVRRDLLGTTDNSLNWGGCWQARDHDVTRRAVLPIRVSSPAGALGYTEARDRADVVRQYLTARGWPDPAVGGNGQSIDLLYAVNLPNDDAATGRIRLTLLDLAAQFNDDLATVDTGLTRAAFLLSVGGMALTHLPDPLVAVDAKLLEPFTFDEPLVVQPQLVDAEPGAVLDPCSQVDARVQQFVREQCVLGESVWTSTGRLHLRYEGFCRQNGIKALSNSLLSKALTDRFGLRADRRKVNGMVTRGLWGIRLRPES